MRPILGRIVNFFREPSLEGQSRRTFRYHLGYALLDAAAGGIIANGPVIAIKEMGAPDWQLGISLTFSGVGIIAVLYLGSWMASRPKMPFVFVPGLLCGLATTTMALTANSFVFLTLSGLGLMFNVVTRPAVAAVVRLNYPASHRGLAVGEIRKWSSLMFLISYLVSASVLDRVARDPMGMVRFQMVLAGLTSLLSYACFKRIRVQEDPGELNRTFRPEIAKSFRQAWHIVVGDGRYRRYLLGCLLFMFSALMYVSYIYAFLEKDLHFNYVQCALLSQVIPAVGSFLMTGFLGRWFDRTNPWKAWAWIRFAWGLDPLLLAATPGCAASVPAAGVVMPVAARVSRGSVQGGAWVMWWQIGVNHFAKPGADTSRYLGILTFLDGIIRLTAPAAGAWILYLSGECRPVLFAIGGLGVILSGVYSLWQGRREEADRRLATIADFEAGFERGNGREAWSTDGDVLP